MLLVAVGVALLAALSGCGHDRLDTSKAQQQIGAKLAAYYRPAAVTDVRCPDKVRLAKGSTFRCTTAVQGETVGILVTQVDAKGSVRFEPDVAVIEIDKTEQDLQAKLAALYNGDGSTSPVTVDCGKARVRVVAPKRTFTCAVTAGTQHFREQVTVDDVAGHVSYRPVT